MPGSMGEGRQGMPPNLMELIRQMMQQRGDQPQRSPWEGQMNHNFGNQPNRRGISQY